jgi:hypothetical protein
MRGQRGDCTEKPSTETAGVSNHDSCWRGVNFSREAHNCDDWPIRCAARLRAPGQLPPQSPVSRLDSRRWLATLLRSTNARPQNKTPNCLSKGTAPGGGAWRFGPVAAVVVWGFLSGRLGRGRQFVWPGEVVHHPFPLGRASAARDLRSEAGCPSRFAGLLRPDRHQCPGDSFF